MSDYEKFCDDSGNVVVERVVVWFYEQGIQLLKDPRFQDFISLLKTTEHSPQCNKIKETISLEEFIDIIDSHPEAKSVIQCNLTVQDFGSFRKNIKKAFDSVKDENSGEVTTYIPGLSTYDANKWSVSFCSTDGQIVSLGDCEDMFTIQSVTKPIIYGITCDLVGSSEVHKYVGKEPSGFGFNKIVLSRGVLPHNPLINIGAIAVTSLIHPDLPISERFEACYSKYKALGAGLSRSSISFNNVVYLSEKQNGHRNYAIGHYLLNKGCINAASTSSMMEILELYFQLCSIEVDTTTASVMGATLANGGKNVFTGEQVLSVNTVQNMLSLMFSCGMYDYSGEWAFEVGLPAKSGVSGLIMVVIPNLGCLTMWSPLLDHYGNSVRGLKFTSNFLSLFETDDNQSVFHPFSNKHSVMSSLSRGGNSCMAQNIMFPAQRRLHSSSRLLSGRRHFSSSRPFSERHQFSIFAGNVAGEQLLKSSDGEFGNIRVSVSLSSGMRKLLNVVRRVAR